MKNAVCFRSPRGEGVYSEMVMARLRTHFRFPTEEPLTKADLERCRDILRETDYIFSTWGMPRLTQEEIREYLPSLRAIFHAAGSVQSFAHEFLREGVAVFSAWGANAIPVAEYTFAQIILAAKGFFQTLYRPADGSPWANKHPPIPFPGNYGARVGILGAGMIGRMVIERLHTLEETAILVFDPFLSATRAAELGVRKTSLDEIFRTCDVISNHLANNSETVGMLDGKLFRQMQPHAVFLNTGRGQQVIESDLIDALREVPSRAAVLDVTWPEPLPEDSPLLNVPNVFLSPHIAGSLGREICRMAEYMEQEAYAFDAGAATKYGVTLEMLKTMA